MAPIAVDTNGVNGINGHAGGMAAWGTRHLPTRKLCPHEDLRLDPKLKPKKYEMAGKLVSGSSL
jgi:hypothetical protein